MTESTRATPVGDGSEADDRSELQHVTVERDDVAVCTMFPREIGEEAMSEQWITATTDSFVSLAQQR
ncbi:hypothetical protein [Natrinema sp. 1APR25-10V2]|uniref:DUF7511 domain-containing protein n=1 Tax=Natrinema sp. 1APR25-10V2 TaxID=2951081 RepID=UPI00287608A3|nr:hypothetical protein [Natrinema sp. 1APR25-10V2]MDS0474921.1 hypothetical protein [Natrinema sp. 1APR25-10V2]